MNNAEKILSELRETCVVAGMPVEQHNIAMGLIEQLRATVASRAEPVTEEHYTADATTARDFHLLHNPDTGAWLMSWRLVEGTICTRTDIKISEEGLKQTMQVLGKIAREVLKNVPEASAEPLDTDAISNICNAYDSGVGHRGRPTAHVNPYRQGSAESIAYALGAIKEEHGMTASAEVPEGVRRDAVTLEMPDFMRRDNREEPPAINRDALALAYGYLWHVNNSRPGYDAPTDNHRPQFSPERAAMEARKVMRDMLTRDERGVGINKAMDMLASSRGEGKPS